VQTNFWTSGRYKAFHTTRTPLLFPGQLCTKGKKLSTKSTTIVQGSLTRQELHGSQQDQRGPIESELNEYGQKRGRVLAPVTGRYGGASSDLSLILDLVAREMARKHTAFYNIGFSEAKALFSHQLARKWGHAIARGWATLLLDRKEVLLNLILVLLMIRWRESIKLTNRKAQNKVFWAVVLDADLHGELITFRLERLT